jgi:hypothetical protein
MLRGYFKFLSRLANVTCRGKKGMWLGLEFPRDTAYKPSYRIANYSTPQIKNLAGLMARIS